MPEATPATVQREDLIQLLRNRTTGQPPETLAAIVDFFLNPSEPITVAGIQRVGGISKPTARRYRDLLIAAIDRHDAMAVSLNPRGERPASSSLERVQLDAHAASVEKRRKSNANAPLTGDDVVSIIDRTLRRLDQEDAPGAAIKAVAELKIKYQQLEAARAERPIDPQKVLGPTGLAGLIPNLIERFTMLLQHRREMPTFWNAIVPVVLAALLDDAHETTDAWPDNFLGSVESFVDGYRALRGPDTNSVPPASPSQAALNMLIDDPVSEDLAVSDSSPDGAPRPSGAGTDD